MNKWAKVAEEVANLVEQKQVAYGDSFGRAGNVMREMYPNGIAPEQMDDALTVVRILDKLFRIASKKGAFGESPYRDIMGYATLGAVRDEEAAKQPSKQADAEPFAPNYTYTANGRAP